MSKQEEADLILRLYDLRREAKMRQARDYYFMEFNPASVADVEKTMFTEQGAYVRMVWSYWDMAAGLVNHGAISKDLFDDTNGEYLGVFAKVEPMLKDLRAAFDPRFMVNLEKLIDSLPSGRERVARVRQRIQEVHAKVASAMKTKAAQG